jgi:hypothetical protein
MTSAGKCQVSIPKQVLANERSGRKDNIYGQIAKIGQSSKIGGLLGD